MNKIYKFIKNNFWFFVLTGFFLVALGVNIKINYFRYNNFDYGKFDLGNMNQMIWNTLHGRFMYLTDYFGTNLPRWAMSHVDPILLLFAPIFILIPHPMTITYAQVLIILLSAFLVYKIALLELKSKFSASILGISFLVYPAIGFITAWTGFHGVSAAIPFFFGAFYVFEKMYSENKFTKKGIILFWTLLIITMTGKEQLPLYVFLYGIFILLFRNDSLYKIKSRFLNKEWFAEFIKLPLAKLSLYMMVVGLVWFVLAFFVIIPHYAPLRVEGFNKFADSLGISGGTTRDVAMENYFLSRYEGFGESYTEVIINVIKNPNEVIRTIFGGDKLDNLNKTFGPLAYLPLASPMILLMAVPDLMINYLTTAGGVGTSEITNHRISMIIPVLFISTIFGISYLSSVITLLLSKKFGNKKSKFDDVFARKVVAGVFSLVVLGSNFYFTYTSNNPVFFWLQQAITKKVLAKTIDAGIKIDQLKVGDVVRLTELEEKDRECAQKMISLIPDNASVSGPDYLGAHLSLRETYAIFPALYNEADYVIVDVFSRKLLSILDIDLDLARNVVENMIKSDKYELVTGCGNLFVFKNVGKHEKPILLPIQEKYEYKERVQMPFFQSVEIVDYKLPKSVKAGGSEKAQFVYVKRSNNSLEDYVTFTSLINTKTKEVYQMANLPSFSIMKPGEWTEGRYYVEDLDLAVPEFLEKGTYKLFIGMGNNIRTRSVYLGDIEIN